MNRLIADDQLDTEVEAIASRLARFDHDAIVRTKSYVDQITLPDNDELGPPWNDFLELVRRPATLAQAARLRELGLNTDGEFERSLGGAWSSRFPTPELRVGTRKQTDPASCSRGLRTSGRNQPLPKDSGGIDESIDLS